MEILEEFRCTSFFYREDYHYVHIRTNDSTYKMHIGEVRNVGNNIVFYEIIRYIKEENDIEHIVKPSFSHRVSLLMITNERTICLIVKTNRETFHSFINHYYDTAIN